MDSCIIQVNPYRQLLPTQYPCSNILQIPLGLYEIQKILYEAGKPNIIQTAMSDEEAGISFVHFKTGASCLSAMSSIMKRYPDICIKTIRK